MTDKEKLEKIKELADAMYYAAGNLSQNVGSVERLRKTMGAYHKFIIYEYHKEEPVSEDLEQAIDTYLATYFGGEKEKQDWPFLKKMAIHFAEWQKEQFENNRLKHCDSITNEQAELEQGFIDQHLDKYQRMPTFLDAIEYGMRLQKAQLMKNAIDTIVKVDAGGYPYIPQIELYDYCEDIPLAKRGDKYKVILIKE